MGRRLWLAIHAASYPETIPTSGSSAVYSSLDHAGATIACRYQRHRLTSPDGRQADSATPVPSTSDWRR
jgi:hypothetical protein